jgi:hypothetical protein
MGHPKNFSREEMPRVLPTLPQRSVTARLLADSSGLSSPTRLNFSELSLQQ